MFYNADGNQYTFIIYLKLSNHKCDFSQTRKPDSHGGHGPVNFCVNRLGLGALALQAKRYCEVVYAAERDWVILPEHYLPELQRLPVHRLSLSVLALQAKRYREIVHAGERVWVIPPENRLPELQRLAGASPRSLRTCPASQALFQDCLCCRAYLGDPSQAPSL